MRKYVWRGNRENRRNMHELELSQWFSRSELEAIQLKKIQRLVAYAYEHVPFYRQRYQSEGIHPQDIKNLEDFQTIPFLTRDDVNNNQETLVSTEYHGKVFERTTGGSTGKPMKFLVDSSALLWSYATEARCRSWFGVKPGDKMAWIYGVLEDFSNWPWQDRLAANIKRHRYLNPRTLTNEKMQAFAKMLIKWKPVTFRTYPSAIAIFAHYLRENDITGITPKLIELTGEKGTPDQHQLIEDVFNAPLADHYSSWEIYDMAYQCPEGSLHVIEDRYLELVANGQVVDPGQTGEVVITSLTQSAMPFIRYKNGDLGIYESEKCSCGRGMPVLREIVGRESDLLSNPDGSIVHWTSFFTVIKYKTEVSRYQMYQPDREHIEVRLICKQKVDSAFLENIRKELQPCFSESMHITVKIVDYIDLTPYGKHRSIISEVKPEFK